MTGATYTPGTLVVHKVSGQRMRIERRVAVSLNSRAAVSYWCTWRTLGGVTRRAMYPAIDLELAPCSVREGGDRYGPRTPALAEKIDTIAIGGVVIPRFGERDLGSITITDEAPPLDGTKGEPW